MTEKMALFLDWLFDAATVDDVTSDDIYTAAEKLGLIRRQSIDGFQFHPDLQALIDNAEDDENGT